MLLRTAEQRARERGYLTAQLCTGMFQFLQKSATVVAFHLLPAIGESREGWAENDERKREGRKREGKMERKR